MNTQRTRLDRSQNPPLAALKKIEAAACRDLAIARVTLGLLGAVLGNEPTLLFPDYHWRLCDVKSFPPNLARSTAQILAWGARRGVVLNELLASRAAITRAVVALRRRSPYGQRRRVIANRCRKLYPQLKPVARRGGRGMTECRTLEILPDEVGRPLSDSTLRRARAFRPSRIEILAHDEGEWVYGHTGGVKIRLSEDGYTVTSITQNLMVSPAKRVRMIYGVLEDFFETGTEGVIWSVVSDDARGYEALYPIEEGDHLTILDTVGHKLWAGKIRCDRKSGWRRYPLNPKCGQPCALGHWVHWSQQGFKPNDWARYFIRPEYDRLRGILRKRRP
jgi:hypothetical protein